MKRFFSFFFTKIWPFLEPLFWLFLVCQIILHVPEIFEALCLANSGYGEPFVLLGSLMMLILFCISWFFHRIFSFLFSLFRKKHYHSDSPEHPG